MFSLINNVKMKLLSLGRKNILFIMLILICTIMVAVFLVFCFSSYKQPYMMKEIFDLSPGWQYSVKTLEAAKPEDLSPGLKLRAGDTLILQRTLNKGMKNAAIMLKSNHQWVNVYLDGNPLFIGTPSGAAENPGMELHFIPLPEDYLLKTLRIELTSPYNLYSGRTGAVFMGTIPSLEAFALSKSIGSVFMMIMCLLLGIAIIAFTFVQALYGQIHPENLAAGLFAVIWALYCVSTEYIVFQFFTPFRISMLSLGLYFSFQAPLSLYFYLSFRHYKKHMLPAVVLHNAFPLIAIFLQQFNFVDLPRLININNILLTGLAYTAYLVVLEARKNNRVMVIGAVFLIIAYFSMLYNFFIFYTRNYIPPYYYKHTYFLLFLCLLVYNIQQFLSSYYLNRRENEALALQSKLVKLSYEQIKRHLKELGGLKHEIKSHLTALNTLLGKGRYDEAVKYLNKYTEQSESISDAVYHEHYIINSLVGCLIRRAGKSGIDVELNLKASPLNIADPDLYSLISNIIDNALEACDNIPDGGKRFVRLSFLRREPYLIVVCENSCNGVMQDENGIIKSRKKEKGHGYGLWMINRIAESYNGHVDMEYDDSLFTLTAALHDPDC